MLQDHAVVRLKHAVSNLPVEPGTLGAVVFVHFSEPAKYEVEFFDENFRTIDVYTVRGEDLEEVKEEAS